MSWMAAVDFRQGVSHRRSNVPCQDFGRLIQPQDDLVIAALSDGAGSARYSHLGARVAVDVVLPWLRARLAEAPGARGTVTSLSPDALFDGMTAVLAQSITRAANDNRVSVDDLACTLTILAVAPNGIIAAQIGDGMVVARLADQDYALMVQPDRGEYANETSFVTDPDAAERLYVTALHGPVRFVSAATDGIASVSLDSRSNRPHAPFFSPIDSFARRSDSVSEMHLGLREFLSSERLAMKVEDDLALMACGWRGLGG